MGVLSRKTFDETYQFKLEAGEPEKCCRKCRQFARHPFEGTICRFLALAAMDIKAAKVFGKSGCNNWTAGGKK
jgi:hypothetical protein